ncbi:MAG: hypothetical protein M3373_08670 [Gemmatimonadota bacterium]|nr:hypothetical protein [Gemmatimonadota bacterium]
MALVLLIGRDASLLEGLSQSLVAACHAVRTAYSVSDAIDVAVAQPPLVVVVERALAAQDMRSLRIPLASGGALMLFGGPAERGLALSPAFGRAALADITLPLERHRLVALIGKVEERALAAGRARRDTPPETRPV